MSEVVSVFSLLVEEEALRRTHTVLEREGNALSCRVHQKDITRFLLFTFFLFVKCQEVAGLNLNALPRHVELD